MLQRFCNGAVERCGALLCKLATIGLLKNKIKQQLILRDLATNQGVVGSNPAGRAKNQRLRLPLGGLIFFLQRFCRSIWLRNGCTGNMTGIYDIYHAALKQSGIIEVRGFEEVSELV